MYLYFFLPVNFIDLLNLFIFIFIPINFNKSSIVKISFTSGTFVSVTFPAKIVAAKIGRVAFFEPEIEIVPESFFFPLIINFCIKEIFKP